MVANGVGTGMCPYRTGDGDGSLWGGNGDGSQWGTQILSAGEGLPGPKTTTVGSHGSMILKDFPTPTIIGFRGSMIPSNPTVIGFCGSMILKVSPTQSL